MGSRTLRNLEIAWKTILGNFHLAYTKARVSSSPCLDHLFEDTEQCCSFLLQEGSKGFPGQISLLFGLSFETNSPERSREDLKAGAISGFLDHFPKQNATPKDLAVNEATIPAKEFQLGQEIRPKCMEHRLGRHRRHRKL